MEVCKQCGGPTALDTRIVAGVRGLDGGGTVPTGFFCGQRCRDAAMAAARLVPTCVGFECSKSVRPAKRVGRPAEYCSTECQRSTERVLNRALRAVARGTVPRSYVELERLARELDFLHYSWESSAPGREGRGVKVRTGRRFPRPKVEPDPAAWRTLVKLRSRVQHVLEIVAEDERRAQAEREDRAFAEAQARMQIANAQAGDAWRERLLAKLGDEEPGAVVVSGSELRKVGWQ